MRTRTATGCWLAIAATCLASASVLAGEAIPFKSGPTLLPEQPPAEVQTVLSDYALLRDAAARRVVVQLVGPVDEATRTALADVGIHLGATLGADAFFATVDSASLQPLGATVNGIKAIADVKTEWKLHPDVLNHAHPTWSITGTDVDGVRLVAVLVMFHRDVDLETIGLDTIAAHGGIVRDFVFSSNALVVELREDLVDILASQDSVLWIEHPLPRFSVVNDCNRDKTQADDVQSAPYGLTGAGIDVLVYDGGRALASHVDFQGRLTTHDSSYVSDHPTHVAGTIGGAGVANSNYAGMAPGVTLRSYGFEYDGSGYFLYSNPGDMESDYSSAINSYGCDISNNSIGSNIESNGFPCEIQGDYGVTSNTIDAIVRGSVSGGEPFRVIWANGNERQGSSCDIEGYGDYYSIAPPSGAKNHIAVGATYCSSSESMSTFSSWGPTDDGRMKPDISAPGVDVTSCGSGYDTEYLTMSGTSMASPTVCGVCALLLEDYRARFSGSDPRNSTLKALLAHNAIDRGNTGPDYQYGYGTVRIKDTIDFMRQGNFFEDELSAGEVYTIEFDVQGASSVKVTLAWDDYPGTPNVSPALVNDLDLRVFDPDDNQYYPWTLNPDNPGAAAVRTQANRLDNIEQVYLTSPTSGTWRIEVYGYDVPEGPQPFSLCASGTLAFPPNVSVSLPSGPSTHLSPGVTELVDVKITTRNDTLVPGSALLHVRYAGTEFIDIPLIPAGGDDYTAELPPATCDASVEYYVSAAGTTSGLTTSPPDAPASLYTATVSEVTTIFTDRFEADLGWTVGAADDDADTGIWNRGDPEGTDAQPEDDHSSPGVYCYATDTDAGSGLGDYDVDGGKTTLFSPTLDLGDSTDPLISYWRWYSNDTGASSNEDVFVVDISNNGGTSWTNAETVGPSGAGTSGGWLYHEFRVTDILTPTSDVVLRFVASDEGSGSLVEAALDDFAVVDESCAVSLDDCNGNGIVDDDDIASGRSADTDGNAIPDECEAPTGCPGDFDCDGDRDYFDIDYLVVALDGQAAWEDYYVAQHGVTPPCDYSTNCDVDEQGDGTTYFDINPFLDLLGLPCP